MFGSVPAAQVARIMGLPDAQSYDYARLDREVYAGLPKEVAERTIEYVTGDVAGMMGQLVFFIPERTYRRRTTLQPEEGAKIQRIARVMATAEYVLGSQHAARRYLMSPHPLFGNKTPFRLISSEIGARTIEDELWRLFHGVSV